MEKKPLEIEKYKMDHPSRGHCFIINNETFKTLPLRKGCEMDVKSLKKLFEGLSFDVKIEKDLTYEQTINFITEGK